MRSAEEINLNISNVKILQRIFKDCTSFSKIA